MTRCVLVVGGAGYIGSHTCKALHQSGYEPVVFDNLSTGHADVVKWGELEIGDIRDGTALDAVMAKYQPIAVIHFAALAYVGESVVHPAEYYDNNVRGSLSLFDSMLRHGVSNLVFSSTCATYGIPNSLPISEDATQAPINPYGFSKLVVERILADYQVAYAFRWAILRYFNAAGCDPDGELGERHVPETHVIPLAIKAALGSNQKFKVFGNDYDTADGTAVRDYVHVSDLARAHVRAVSYLCDDGISQAFNLGTGKGTTVKEIVAAVENSTGRRVPLEFVGRRAGDPPALFASATRAREVLGWVPDYTDIDATIATAVGWFARQNDDLVG